MLAAIPEAATHLGVKRMAVQVPERLQAPHPQQQLRIHHHLRHQIPALCGHIGLNHRQPHVLVQGVYAQQANAHQESVICLKLSPYLVAVLRHLQALHYPAQQNARHCDVARLRGIIQQQTVFRQPVSRLLVFLTPCLGCGSQRC